MSKEFITRMAQEAGFVLYDMHDVDGQDLGESVEANDFKVLERFSEQLIVHLSGVFLGLNILKSPIRNLDPRSWLQLLRS